MPAVDLPLRRFSPFGQGPPAPPACCWLAALSLKLMSAGFPDVVTCVEEIRQPGWLAVREVEGDLIVSQRTTAGVPT